jgi:diguanylate cyclase (GGDEF)-like protein
VHDEHGRIANYVGIQNDISERMHYEEQLAHQAKHDALTDLPNRSLLEDRLRQVLNHAHRQKWKMAVVFVDLDHFKFINDSLGHELGDRLLVTVANRLKDCLREVDTVARQGGDEFVLILSDIQDDQAITQTLQRIIAAVAEPVSLGNRNLVVTCSVGVSIYPEDGQDSQTLLKSADIAMYRAKEQGRNCFQFYTAELNARVTERLTLESALRRALEQGEFLLHFQPQVDLRSGRITGVEALCRWLHPEIGMIAPSRFIPLAEDTGLIVQLGEWVLTAACVQVKVWLDAGLPIPSVAVNISAVQFRQGNIVQTVKRVLESTGLAPQYLELEITESLAMHQAEQVITIMAELKVLGVQISLDDFGTGYSSLSYLKRFPLDKLKIDQSFISDVATDLGDAAIVRSVILLAHSLGLVVIAEGVETAEQLAYLCGQQCDQIQGYLFSRPIPADDLEEMLRLGKILSTCPQIVAIDITSAPALSLSI